MDTNKEKHYWLYVLKLEQGKFYVGITSKTVEERFKQHKSEFLAAEWTKIYKPISIDQVRDLGVTTYARAEQYENKVTRKYIQNYGLDNVRGGNLSYRGRMVKRVGYFWRFDDWKDFTMAWGCALFLFFTSAYILWDAVTRH